MKTLSYVAGSALSLFVLLSPVRAEETAGTPAPAAPAPANTPQSNSSLVATLLADLLKQQSSGTTTTTDKVAPAAAAAPASAGDAQTQELQTLLVSVMKSIAQMLPQFLSALDSAQASSGSGGGPFNIKVDDFVDSAVATVKKVREQGLHSAGLKTSGLSPDGTPAATTDEDWKRQFQQQRVSPAVPSR